jgi:lactate permease
MTGFGYVNAATSSFSPFSPLTHAGMFLLVSSYIGYVFFKKHGWIEKDGGKAVLKAVTWTKPCHQHWQFWVLFLCHASWAGPVRL